MTLTLASTLDPCYEARVVVLQAQISQVAPTQIVFAWTKATQVPLILGQVNFFMEFDVCFYRSQLYFAVSPKRNPSAENAAVI